MLSTKYRHLAAAILFATILLIFLSGSVSAKYEVKQVNNGNLIEHRFFFNENHFMTVIDDQGTLNIRPHPGADINGWGSSLYLQPFLPGATLKYTKIESIKSTTDGIKLIASGKVSKGKNENYGQWQTTLDFSYNQQEKTIQGKGEYEVNLDSQLSPETGDLNLYKLASNYLDDVPLLTGQVGDTGDMEKAEVAGDSFSFNWIPENQPVHFPQDLTNYLSVDVIGRYNNVDTAAQGYDPIAAAYKPSMKVILDAQNPETKMIFGGIYDEEKSKDFFEDNVGITPLILKGSQQTDFKFDISIISNSIEPSGEPETIWEFSKFVNLYKVYRSYTCVVEKKNACPSEISWQGKKLNFQFDVKNKKELTRNVEFIFNVDYVIPNEGYAIVDIYAGKKGTALSKAGTIKIKSTGEYAATIPKKLFRKGQNIISMRGRNVVVGYGKSPPGFVIDEVSLKTIPS